MAICSFTCACIVISNFNKIGIYYKFNMKANQFIKLLRNVIREEVQVAVRTELRILTESIKQPEAIFETKAPVKTKKTVQPNVRAPKQYVKNQLLNEILNDTSGYNQSIGEFDEYPTMPMSQMRMSSSPAIITDFEGRSIDVNSFAQTESGAAVVNAITKDYSALMKAIDAKKGK